MYIPIVLNQVPASHPLRAVHHQFVTDLNMLLPSQSDRLGSGERTGLRFHQVDGDEAGVYLGPLSIEPNTPSHGASRTYFFF
jgi:hypothetical protein